MSMPEIPEEIDFHKICKDYDPVNYGPSFLVYIYENIKDLSGFFISLEDIKKLQIHEGNRIINLSPPIRLHEAIVKNEKDHIRILFESMRRGDPDTAVYEHEPVAQLGFRYREQEDAFEMILPGEAHDVSMVQAIIRVDEETGRTYSDLTRVSDSIEPTKFFDLADSHS